MSQPVIEPRDEQSAESAGRAVGAFFAFVFFVLAFVLFALSFPDGETVAWTFVGGILSMAVAFAIPTMVMPAIEDR